MNMPAVFHRASGNYCYTLNRDTLRISIKTGEDVSAVTLVWGDPFKAGILGADVKGWSGEESPIIDKRRIRDGALWWCVDVHPLYKRARYFFKVTFANVMEESGITGEYIFCEDGFHPISDLGMAGCVLNAFVFPWMNEADICTVPKWVGDAVWYQIFPARFCRSSVSPIDNTLLPWAGSNHAVTNDERYGGNIAGITERLDYISGLGVTGVYLTPINAAPSQHKYDTTDYTAIDSSFGTKEDMCRFVAEAHRRGIRVMLDGVFNHTGPFFFAWRDVVKKREKSQYKDWFIINDMTFDVWDYHNADKGKYYTFAFHDGMPKLNTNNPEVIEYICGVCEGWVKGYDIDALRLDVANEVSHTFCRALRMRMKALKTDFYIVGEIWHNALPWLEGSEFDAVMNYPLANALLHFATSHDGARRLEEDINRCLTSYSEQVTRVLLNQADSHDTMRMTTRLGNKERALQCLTLLFCLPGAACIYYGTEVLLEGGRDPDCRRCMPWSEIDEGKYESEIAFVKNLIALRHKESALRAYDTRFVYGAECVGCGVESGENERIVHIIKKSTEDSENNDGVIDAIFNFSDNGIRLMLLERAVPLLSMGYDASEGILHSNGLVLFKR